MNALTNLSDSARTIFADALAACSVEQAFRAKLQPWYEDNPYAFRLRGGTGEPQAEIDLTGAKRVIVIAAGKGAATMLHGLLRGMRIPAGCALAGVLVSPERPRQMPEGIEYFAGGHPLPTQESFAAAETALTLIDEAAKSEERERTFCFFLISGGASAMMELPLDGSITLADTIAFNRALVHSGASIVEINCVRKHFSAVKGGRLGQAAAAIPNLTILVSDVPEGQLDALASGPTLPDRSTVEDCREVLARYELLRQFPAAVRRFFAQELPETPKPAAYTARVCTLLSSGDLAEAARSKAEELGFATVVDNSCDDWEYRRAAEYLLEKLRELRRKEGRICLISTGEVTVTVDSGGAGVGGRNQHIALYAATLLEAEDRPAAFLSAGSDGIDGNSRFAGAVVECDSARGVRDEARRALLQFNSSELLDRIQATIETGPTGNNLRDLRLFLCE